MAKRKKRKERKARKKIMALKDLFLLTCSSIIAEDL